MSLFEALSLYPWLAISLVGVIGLLVGSFLNVVIYRLPIMMEREWKAHCADLSGDATPDEQEATFNLAVPRSACPHCGHGITAAENIPVLSYLFLGGKCSSCKTLIAVRYPLIEAITGLASAFVIFQLGFSWVSLTLVVFTWVLIALTMIDYDHQLLPDSLTLPLLWLGLIVNTFNGITDLQSAVWGAVAGYLSLWSVYWLFKLTTGKEGMGYGDFKLLAALGAWLGWQLLPLIIILSSLVGAVVGILLITTAGRDGSKPIPFGPFLAAAGWIAMTWGDTLIHQYWKVLGL